MTTPESSADSAAPTPAPRPTRDDRRSGIGWDSHRLVEGRPFILGGVRIESPVGLHGHSDADVLAHAITDAILGAAGLGDIGDHFPDTDASYSGADSIKLLQDVPAPCRATEARPQEARDRRPPRGGPQPAPLSRRREGVDR